MVLRRVLVVDDESNILASLKGVLEDEGYEVETAKDAEAALLRFHSFRPDITLLDIWMPGEDGIWVLDKIKTKEPNAIVIMMSGHGTVETAVRTIKLGAFDFLEKPLQFDKLLLLMEHAFELKRLKAENQYLKTELGGDEEILGQSQPILQLKKLISVVAPSNGWVLANGENGTGKELVARSLHRGSPRANGPFIAVNCAAIPEELVESELFGHERGSFTGANEKRIGKFELAHRGTLFLDEVGDMSSKMQAKILRALQECRIQRVGGETTVEIDVRVIAATNKDLKKEIAQGRFREDLFYRLNVIPLSVPPLRDRREDIPELVDYFVRRYSLGKTKKISPEVREWMLRYGWPGNVRELKNWCERACLLSQSDWLESPDGELEAGGQGYESSEASTLSEDKSLKSARAAFEKRFIVQILSENGGNISKTALSLGLERSHLHKKIKGYGIDVQNLGGN